MSNTINADCKTCHGEGSQTTLVGRGRLIQLPCTDCDGAGQTERSVESLMEEACRLDDEIKGRTAEIITPLQDQLDQLKSLIADIVIAGGETVHTPYGRAEYVKAGERVSWDDRGLLGFAVTHPEILKLRAAKETAQSVRIKFEVKPPSGGGKP